MGNCECSETAASSKPGNDWALAAGFVELVACCERDVDTYYFDQLRSHEKARDATQETFFRTWRNKHNYDPAKVSGKIKIWLLIIAPNMSSEIWQEDHPVIVAFRSLDHATTAKGNHFLFPIVLAPSVAVCTALDLPDRPAGL